MSSAQNVRGSQDGRGGDDDIPNQSDGNKEGAVVESDRKKQESMPISNGDLEDVDLPIEETNLGKDLKTMLTRKPQTAGEGEDEEGQGEDDGGENDV